jgi:hypothetical protein
VGAKQDQGTEVGGVGGLIILGNERDALGCAYGLGENDTNQSGER